ncbi:hypothetical protein [Pedobacter sp.]|uniref:hypothetical protein n=1 Tax=Pedobacter sp. TaxID=1411316 RepID=UPI002CAC152C|nr:hypothetical protein [Pedobacter sp.]HWW42760.1 hypothetical protein [Pedobacter sp.]
MSANYWKITFSMKSDMLPVLELVGFSAHIPYHTTWVHEQVEPNLNHPNLSSLRI